MMWTADDVIKLLVAIGGSGVVVSAVQWVVRRPVITAEDATRKAELRAEKLEKELDWFKDRFKSRVVVTGQRVEAIETEERGTPSLRAPNREKLDTLTAIEHDALYEQWAQQRERNRETSVLQGQRVEALGPPLGAFAAPRRAVVEVDGRQPGARPTDPAPTGYPAMRPPPPRRRG